MTPPTILDGGMGQELIHRGAPRSPELWSAWAMLEDPDLVTGVHADYVEAGCDILTTNSYATFADRLHPHGLGDRADELTRLSGHLARGAADASERLVLVAASLPPMRGSYCPNPDGTYEELRAEYAVMVDQVDEGLVVGQQIAPVHEAFRIEIVRMVEPFVVPALQFVRPRFEARQLADLVQLVGSGLFCPLQPLLS